MIGSQINQYKILEKIGSGGQGTVYKALDTKLHRTVVIKILPPELTAKTANFKRFEREAQLCSQLDHPNICTIYDFHEASGDRNRLLSYAPNREFFIGLNLGVRRSQIGVTNLNGQYSGESCSLKMLE